MSAGLVLDIYACQQNGVDPGASRAEDKNPWTRQTTSIRRKLGPLRRLADRRGVLPGRDVRLGARLLRPERLCRRTASVARLAGVADLRPAPRSSTCSVRRWSSSSAKPSRRSVRAIACWWVLRDGGGHDRDRSGHASPGSFSGRCHARLRLGRHQPRYHHQYARALVRTRGRACW